MDLMIVKDTMPIEPAMVMLTGSLCLTDIARRSEVELAFGEEVVVETNSGKRIRVAVRSVSVSQALSGVYQVSVAVALPNESEGVALESVVTNGI